MKPRRSLGSSLLHFAVFHDDVDLVKKLIEKGADPEHKNGEGDSPLDDARERASGVALSLCFRADAAGAGTSARRSSRSSRPR